jgi:hypothetical protein
LVEQFARLGVWYKAAVGRTANAQMRGLGMCEKCEEIDNKIERYRQIKRSIMDQLTVDRTRELIAELESSKVALHPKQPE